ncbi:sulfurtransferase [Corynebacterium sp. P7202]|uniref:Sulfurtransferase n=1 Tax=Corynebacterium pygosceleis TaxID=2800406 RepID=A0A9Q4C7S4_9CORY|nr:sulfurtransferase [Corynebacterium pygosceleis]MCK7637127.1 sulfurtransferase [Corynebacterium pygosceleis]MCX7443645.1 sulfurtransferase [Corynebacterium pygosceleis]MCX7467881.1 sulfurtransferase [Corynebacterium pygosceleis]
MSSVTVPGSVVSVGWLSDRLSSGDADLVVLCASMGDPAKSAEGIPGAFLADLEGDFSDPDSPLPHTVPTDVRGVFEARGISDGTAVVVYDRFGVLCAPRVWWLAKVAGLDNVAVLDGGLPAWVGAGHRVEQLAVPAERGVIAAEPRPDLLVGVSGVSRALARSAWEVVDARSAGRFIGVEPEPRPGLKAGHIPGSVNIPFTRVLDANGHLRDPGELAELFRSVVGDARRMTFTCGSGVTACVDALAAERAGYTDLTVYDGSWSEWGNPRACQPVGP